MAACLLAAGLAGGAASAADAPEPVDTEPVETVSTQAGSAPDPLRQLARLDEARVLDELTRRVAVCLAERGFDWTPPIATSSATTARILALQDAPPTSEEIYESGYEWRGTRFMQLAELNDGTNGSEVTPEMSEHHEQCSGQVAREMGYVDWLELVGQLYDVRAKAYYSVREHPRYLEVEAQWAACFAGRGYAETSLDHILTVHTRTPDGAVDEAVLAMAIADFDCRFELDVIGLEAELTRDYLEAWVANNPAVVAQVNATRARLYAEVDGPR